jgi:hypothetical protein
LNREGEGVGSGKRKKKKAEPSTPPDQGSPVAYEVRRGAAFLLKDRLLETVLTPEGPRFVMVERDGTLGRVLAVASGPLLMEYWLDDVAKVHYEPITVRHIRSSNVKLPTTPEPYETTAQLDAAITAFVRKYVVLPADIEPLIPVFVRATWLAERSRTAPILRLSGLPGSGKSRAAKVLASISMKPYVTNGNTTPPSLFRNIDRIGVGTTILDENEFNNDSDMHRTLVQVLKIGFEAGGEIERCAESDDPDDKGQQVFRFPVFGPKIVAAIHHAPDAALATRCIPVEMIAKRNPRYIELPSEFEDEAAQLQNKLLQWRIDHVFREIPEPRRLDNVRPRLLQLMLPLAKVVDTEEQSAALEHLILDLEDDMRAEDSQSIEQTIADILCTIMESGEEKPITYTMVAAGGLMTRPGEITERRVGKFVRALGLQWKKPKGRGREITTPWAEIKGRLVEVGFVDSAEAA